MRMTKYYKVAGHVFGMTAEPAHLEDCANYEPFGCSDEDDAVFMLRVESGEAPAFTEEMRQEDEGLHQTENRLATSVPTWHLECLPDADAAQLCNREVKSGK